MYDAFIFFLYGTVIILACGLAYKKHLNNKDKKNGPTK